MTSPARSQMADNVRNLRPGQREQLQAQINVLEDRQVRRREAMQEQEKLMAKKQLEIDNLRGQLDACDD
jgi:hypothetical protein